MAVHSFHIGVFFLFFTTTYVSFSIIITYLFSHNDNYSSQMGPLVLFTNYGTFMIFSIVAPAFKKSPKTLLIAGSLTYMVYFIVAIFEPKGLIGNIILLSCSCISGAGAALSWLNQGAYMEQLLREHNIPY